MALRLTNSNVLIVEGHDDKHSVIGLMEHHVDWPDGRENAPVYVDVGGSVDEILKRQYLSAQLKRAGLKSLGVILDGDMHPYGRYQRLRDICLEHFPSMPEEMPTGGLVITDHAGLRFGAWVMPDNQQGGDLETFLSRLVPGTAEVLWQHAVRSVDSARKMGATCRDCHLPKANLYTWLAWHDPPSQSPGITLKMKVLDPHCPAAAGFVEWFKKLYALTA